MKRSPAQDASFSDRVTHVEMRMASHAETERASRVEVAAMPRLSPQDEEDIRDTVRKRIERIYPNAAVIVGLNYDDNTDTIDLRYWPGLDRKRDVADEDQARDNIAYMVVDIINGWPHTRIVEPINANLLDVDVEYDYELAVIMKDIGLSFDDKVRKAGLLLETRVRQASGLKEHDFGAELMNAAFSEKGPFGNVSPVKAENHGLLNLFQGAVLYYRNPVSHRAVNHTAESATHVMQLINHLLYLLDSAAAGRVDTKDFIGFHEGRVRERRDYGIDINGDKTEDLVVLLSTGPIMVNGSAEYHLVGHSC